MKKTLLTLGLGFTAFLQMTAAQALPATLNEVVYLQSFGCGADNCYLDVEVAGIDNVSIATLCGDRKYCNQYYKAYEKIANQASEDDYPVYEIGRKARVQMKLVNNENSGQKIYEATQITYLAD